MAKTDDPTLISVAGPYLKELRDKAGKQQREFADTYGFEASALSKLENGNGLGPRQLPKIVEAYAEAAGVSAPDVWAEIGRRLTERDRETSRRAQRRSGDARRSEQEKKRRRGQDQ